MFFTLNNWMTIIVEHTFTLPILAAALSVFFTWLALNVYRDTMNKPSVNDRGAIAVASLSILAILCYVVLVFATSYYLGFGPDKSAIAMLENTIRLLLAEESDRRPE